MLSLSPAPLAGGLDGHRPPYPYEPAQVPYLECHRQNHPALPTGVYRGTLRRANILKHPAKIKTLQPFRVIPRIFVGYLIRAVGGLSLSAQTAQSKPPTTKFFNNITNIEEIEEIARASGS
jgi:hypothetical protein